MTTRDEARDEINGRVKAVLDAYNTAEGASLQAYYEDVSKMPSDGRSAHLRVFVGHASGGQASLGGVGNRRFERRGIVTVQVMTPFGDGFTLADALATVARNAFEGVTTPNGVWFQNVSPGQEMGKTGPWQQTNVTATFVYTERR